MAIMDSSIEVPPQPSSVEDIVILLTREVQQSFARLIGALPGRIIKAIHLQKCLEIDAKVAWQVFRIAKADDPLEAVRYMPSMASLKRVLAAGQKKGIPADVLDAMQEAVSQYDAAGREHADDRASFASMISSLRNDEGAEALAQQRARAAFRENCHIWGTQVGVFFSQGIVCRAPTGETVSVASTVKADIRKLRAGVEPVAFGFSRRTKDGQHAPATGLPIDADAHAKYGIPLLPQFCSQPVPVFGVAELKDGWTFHKMMSEQIGKQSSIDVACSVSYPDPGLMTLSNGKKINFINMAFRAPTETMVIELLVHRPTVGEVRPHFRVVPEIGADLIAELERPQPQLLNFASPQFLGAFTSAPPVSEVRHYTEMTNYVLQSQGWKGSEFDVYRVTLAYPILHTLTVLWFELP